MKSVTCTVLNLLGALQIMNLHLSMHGSIGVAKTWFCMVKCEYGGLRIAHP